MGLFENLCMSRADKRMAKMHYDSENYERRYETMVEFIMRNAIDPELAAFGRQKLNEFLHSSGMQSRVL